ncbi:MAG: amino acid adenylation protein, partial [Planctomycetes bacterium]|nr:amino acid adenylation protein [Planctomycetota bacterium]
MRRAVAAELPAYMVPAHFAWQRALPRTVGGKVSRKDLPRHEPAAVAGTFVDDGSLRAVVRRGFGEVLGLADAQLADDDDFFACGGNSLRAALLVSQLRQHEDLRAVAVRDVYRAPTVAGLLAIVGARGAGPVARVVDAAAHGAARGSIARFTAVQVAFLSAAFVVVAAGAWAIAAFVLPWLLSWTLSQSLWLLPWLAPLLSLLLAGLATPLAVAAKWALIGRYRAGRVPAWSGLRLRHWLVVRFAQLVPWGLIEGTELHAVVLRLFGARVGRRVHVHRGVALHAGGWDLLELGDDVTLGRDVELTTCELDDGELVCGPIRVGAGATLEARAGAGPDTVIGERATVRPLGFVASGGRVAA